MTDLESAAAEIVQDTVSACYADLHVDQASFAARIVSLAQDYYVDTTAAVRREEHEASRRLPTPTTATVVWDWAESSAIREHSPL